MRIVGTNVLSQQSLEICCMEFDVGNQLQRTNEQFETKSDSIDKELLHGVIPDLYFRQ